MLEWRAMNDLPPLFAAPPSVYAVGDEYRICVPSTAECTMWVECAGLAHFDHANGILRSGRPVHMASLPQRDLDRARAYAVCLRPIVERKPYYTQTGSSCLFGLFCFLEPNLVQRISLHQFVCPT